MPPTPAEAARNKLAKLRRMRRPPEEIAKAREALAEALIRTRIAEVVEKSVPLTDDQRQRLAAIFTEPGPMVPDEIRRAS